MSWLGKIGDVVETRRGDGTFSIEWRISDFLSLASEQSDRYSSPVFDACGGRCLLKIYPKGSPGLGLLDSVGLCLWRLDSGSPKTLNVTLGIRGAEGIEKKRERNQEFSEDDPVFYWCKFCSRLELAEEKSRLMPGNVLVISLDLKKAVPSIARDSSKDAKGNNVDDDEDGDDDYDSDDDDDDDDDEENDEDSDDNKSPKSKIDVKQNAKKRFETLVKDFGKLLSSDEDSDVTVQVGDVEFKVHRLILSARSPVLSAMFKHETEERATNRITIQDCEPEVFKEYLQYLYSGSVELLSEQNVFHLYRVADKYLAEELKEQCLMHIRDTLSVQTFCDTLKVALTHGESGLLEQAIDYATENIRSIIRTVEWQNFIREYPTEANEALIKSLGPPCESRKSKR